MKVIVHEVTEITRKLEISVPAEEVVRELNHVYEEIGKKANLKGFRPGKIPRPVLEQYYKKEAEEEAVQHLVTETYPQAIDSAKIHPVSYPEISVLQFNPGTGLNYEAVIEVRPTIDVKDYVGLTLTKGDTTASEKEIEESLKEIRERAAQLVPIAEARKAKAGDIVLFDYEAFHEGKPIPGLRAEGTMIELGLGHLPPEFEKGFLEMSREEKKEIEVTYPAEMPDKALAGKKILYHLNLKELKEKKLPVLDDDFAKDLGGFSTLQEVKDQLKAQISGQKDQREKNLLARQAVEQMEKKNKIPIPEGMIRIEGEAMWRDFAALLRQQGLTPEKSGVTQEDFLQKNKEEARVRVLGGLLFDAISRKEGLTVTQEEIDQRLEVMAKGSGQPLEAWKKHYQEKNLYPALEANLREEKTLDFVLSKAKIKTKQ